MFRTGLYSGGYLDTWLRPRLVIRRALAAHVPGNG